MVNLFGAAIMADALLPLLKKSKVEGSGRILNISSGLGSIATMSDPEGQYKGVWLTMRASFPYSHTTYVIIC